MVKEIRLRRSIRKYSDKVISDEDILEIIHAACMAPSALNQQPWAFKVASDKETKDLVGKSFLTTHFAKNASHIILFLMDKRHFRIESMAPLDVSSAITMALLEAQSKGIGSCWCGVYPSKGRMKKCQEIFKIEESRYIPFGIVTFGYPEKEDAFYEAKREFEERILK